MKTLFESWNKYIKEQEGDETILYHVSSVPDIEVLDPAIAVQNRQIYSTAEYRAWDQPRVFYFTKWGQEDTGVGEIPGKNVYKVHINKSDLYDIYKDPDCYSCRDRYDERVKEYKKMRAEPKTDEEGNEYPGTPEYYPVNSFRMVHAFLQKEQPNIKGFIYPQSGNRDNMIVALWEPVPVERLDKSSYNKEEN